MPHALEKSCARVGLARPSASPAPLEFCPPPSPCKGTPNVSACFGAALILVGRAAARVPHAPYRFVRYGLSGYMPSPEVFERCPCSADTDANRPDG